MLPRLPTVNRTTVSIPTIASIAAINPDGFIRGKKTVLPGMGANRLRHLQARATMRVRRLDGLLIGKPIDQ